MRLRAPGSVLLVLAMGLVLGAGSTWADDPESGTRGHAETAVGVQALAAGRVTDALASLTQAQADWPTSRHGRWNLALAWSHAGRAARRKEDATASLAAYEQARRLHPERLRHRLGHARALHALTRLDEALDAVDRLLEAAPDWADAHLLRADITEDQGRLDLSLEALAAAREGLRGREREVLAQRITRVERLHAAEGRYVIDQSTHFRIQHDADLPVATVAVARGLLEDAWTHVTAELGVTPRRVARVVLYGGDEFREATGARAWAGALYENGTLRVPARNLERHRNGAARILAHEFTHHVLSDRTPHLTPLWHEGIAQWQEETLAPGRAPRVDLVALAADGRLLSFSRMATVRPSHLQAGEALLFYEQSRQFVLWLVDRHGRSGITAFLLKLGTSRGVDAAARAAFGDGQAGLWKAWLATLAR